MNDDYKRFKDGKAAALIRRHIVKFEGSDHIRYLNGQLTNNVAALEPDTALFSAVTNGKGKMDGEVWLRKGQDCIYIDMPMELQETLPARFEKYIIADDVTMKHEKKEWNIFHVLQRPDLNLHDAIIISSKRLGEEGFDLWLPKNTPCPMDLVNESIIETVRVENAVPLWGREMGTDLLPPELGMDEILISYTKGCYIGQEIISRIKSMGHVNRRLTLLHSQEEKIPICPMDLFAGDKNAGKITSSTYSPRYKKVVALGLVHRQYLGSTTSLQTHAQQHWIIP